MNHETLALVEKLATKLGTTAEHLWAILVRQAPISSTVDVVVSCTMSVALYFAIRRLRKTLISHTDEFETFTAGIVCLLVSVILITYAIVGLDLTIAGFFNPEYWALKQIIK